MICLRAPVGVFCHLLVVEVSAFLRPADSSIAVPTVGSPATAAIDALGKGGLWVDSAVFVRGVSASEGSTSVAGCGSEEDGSGAELVELELIVELSAVLEKLVAGVPSG